MTVPWSFGWSLCLLPLLLARHAAHAAPDFSRKCFLFLTSITAFDIEKVRNADRLLFSCINFVKGSFTKTFNINCTSCFEKQPVQLKLTDQNQGEEAAERVLNLDHHRTERDTPSVINSLQFSWVRILSYFAVWTV